MCFCRSRRILRISQLAGETQALPILQKCRRLILIVEAGAPNTVVEMVEIA